MPVVTLTKAMILNTRTGSLLQYQGGQYWFDSTEMNWWVRAHGIVEMDNTPITSPGPAPIPLGVQTARLALQ